MLIVTTDSIEGKKITKHIGLVSGEAILDDRALETV